MTTDDFAAVIDGSTSKGNMQWSGKTTGRTAMELLTDSIVSLPERSTAFTALEVLTERIRRFYVQHGLCEEVKWNPENRLTASCVIYSHFRKEIWMFGDCLCRFNGKTYTHPKHTDRVLSEIRADILAYLIRKGHSIESLQARDLAREWILPYLKDQCAFQNTRDAGPYSYAVLDGFTVFPDMIRILPVSDETTELILASDGYPYLEDSLEDTERRLSALLHSDPLCYRKFKSTKGCIKGNVSYDDRSYLRLSLN